MPGAMMEHRRRFSPARTWRALSGRHRLAVGLLGVLMVLVGWRTYEWWNAWTPRLVLRADGNVMPLDFSPDGKMLATSVPAGLLLWDATTGREGSVWKQPVDHSMFEGQFSSDGKTFLAGRTIKKLALPFGFEIIDVESGRTRATLPSPVGGFFDLVFPPGGVSARSLGIGKGANPLEFFDFDLTTGAVTKHGKLSAAPVHTRAALTPDGRFLAMNLATSPNGTAGSTVQIWDIENDRGVASLTNGAAPPASSLVFSPDGKTLVVGRDGGAVEFWDVATGKLTRAFPGHTETYSVLFASFSRDGSTLVTGARYMGGGISADRLHLEFARLHGGRGYNPTTEMIVFDVKTGRVRGRLNATEGRPTLSPDGGMLATFDSDGSTKIRDVPR